MEHSFAFVRVFEEFLTSHAFKRVSRPTISVQSSFGTEESKKCSHAFESQAFLRVVKVLFEGQTRRMPALMVLKQTFPSMLGNRDFSNYLKVTKGMSTNKNTNLINQYVRESPNKAGGNQD